MATEQTIEKISLDILSDTSQAVRGINNLAKSVDKLTTANVAGMKQLKNISDKLNSINTPLAKIKANYGEVTKKMNEFTKAIDSMSNMLQGLETRKISNMATAFSKLNDLGVDTTPYKELKENVKELKTAFNGLSVPFNQANKSFEKSVSNVFAYSNSINALSSAFRNVDLPKITVMGQVLRDLSETAQATTSFASLAQNMKSLNTGINSLGKAMNVLPYIVEQIEKLDLSKFESQIKQLTNIIKPFNKEMGNASNVIKLFGSSLKSVPSNINKVDSEMKELNTTAKKMSTTLKGIRFLQTINYGLHAFRMITDSMGYFIEKSNEYTENLNLFSVAMGENALKAEQFINELDRALGIDPAEATRFMGLFYQISTSLGLATEKAYRLSESFTKLTYDLASFYNISVENAFEKLRAGLVGETEPLRYIPMAQSKFFERYQRCA